MFTCLWPNNNNNKSRTDDYLNRRNAIVEILDARADVYFIIGVWIEYEQNENNTTE